MRLSWQLSSSRARTPGFAHVYAAVLALLVVESSMAIPSCRQSSLVEAPAACCLSAAMICSS